MKFVLFYHSLISDWNHGNAHFLRGVVSELLARGHRVDVYEPAEGWSLKNLLEEQGPHAVAAFRKAYPELMSRFYTVGSLDLHAALDGAQVCIVHEWTEPELVKRIGAAARAAGCRVLFHDTHHRAATDPNALASLDLSDYDGVLAFGKVICDLYISNRWADSAWTWHEAADIRRFHPLPHVLRERDLVWVGNWGDEERTRELQEFLIHPIAALRLDAEIYGVRYPPEALRALDTAGIRYGGWLPNHFVPEKFASARCTVHVPRRAYTETLPGIPTIRVFEALACGIPLISAPWSDAELLFTPGKDYLVAQSGDEMRAHLQTILNDRDVADELAARGLQTIRARHTCAHRVDELLNILNQLDREERIRNFKGRQLHA